MFFKVSVLKIFANIDSKTPVLESLLNKVEGRQIYLKRLKQGVFL